jgi:predicted ArsR family transcriptional regulator
MDGDLFPGQVKRAEFSLEQVETLASAIRGEVFWAFTPDHPQSVAEVASGLGKSPQTVHYHVNELARLGLLIAVDSRRQGARTEKLFVHASKTFMGKGAQAPREYRDHAVRGFQAITRTMGRENEALHRVIDVDPSITAFSLYWRTTIRLTPERAQEVKQKLKEVMREAAEADMKDDGARVIVSVYMAPTLSESRRWRERIVGESPTEEPDDSDDK